MHRQVTHDGVGSLQVRFPYDRALVELVKTLPHRRWNAVDKYWSVPETDVVSLVELLYERGFDFDRATCDLYRGMGGRAALVPREFAVASRTLPGLFDDGPAAEAAGPARFPPDAAGDYTVSQLNERVREVLQTAFPAAVWTVGEISGFDRSAHRRHVTFELVERARDGRAVSKIPAVLFASTRETIESALERAGRPFRLEDEVEVRVRVTVGLYVPWGQYRVVVEELDPSYTLGEAARRREEILRRLAEAGLLGRNRELSLHPLPLRVGLVTSLGSDAYNDVLRTLQESGYAFRVTAHGARVQGHATEPSVLNALDWFREHADAFDVVLLCRGGGARTDLVWFDSEALGRALAAFPLPVVVGIGHEQDQSVLDAVGRSCKTPTAAAALLVETVRNSLAGLEGLTREVLARAMREVRQEGQRGRERARRLSRGADQLLRHERLALGHRRRGTVVGARAMLVAAREVVARWAVRVPRGALRRTGRGRQLLEQVVRALRQGARADLRGASERIDRAARGLRPRGTALLRHEVERIEQRARRARLVHPRRVLERGYAILRLDHGPVLTSASQAPPGRSVRAELREGALRLRSEGGGPSS